MEERKLWRWNPKNARICPACVWRLLERSTAVSFARRQEQQKQKSPATAVIRLVKNSAPAILARPAQEFFYIDIRRLPESRCRAFRIACPLRRRSRSRKEVVHVDDSCCAPGPSVDWRTPNVAVQQELGVLPERWFGSDRAHSSRARTDRKSVR